jgi:hypothetical protein
MSISMANHDVTGVVFQCCTSQPALERTQLLVLAEESGQVP